MIVKIVNEKNDVDLYIECDKCKVEKYIIDKGGDEADLIRVTAFNGEESNSTYHRKSNTKISLLDDGSNEFAAYKWPSNSK